MRHEIPTVFVHGHAAPNDVQYVEQQLIVALLNSSAVQYSVLWIDTVVSTDVAVEIEAGLVTGTVGSRVTGTSVRAAGDACIAAFLHRMPVLVDNGT
ncbi:MAG: hypothetical protein QOI55_2696 [Actinomycetota bacterium]|nr:hypothetical protein [Actinomycetota bacterium]